jgi:CheY-like chemotaxis protein
MPKGGILNVKTENITLNENDSRNIIGSHPGRYVKLSIQDNGIGMKKEVVQRIFEPFFTTKGVGKGTGLGMSVVYGIVKQHNGWVNVYSEPCKGTIFTIYLPVSSDSDKKESAVKEKVEIKDIKGHGERILIVEDNEGIIQYTSRVLSKNGYIVFLARNVKEALEIYEKEKGNFNMVISDVVLPDKPGTEVVTQFLLGKPELKVIFTSGYLDDKSQLETIRNKGHKFLQKPFELNELLNLITSDDF